MKLLVCTVVFVLAGAVSASAQRDVIETVVFRTISTDDPVRSLEFGYGPSYTDSMDCFTRNECEIPAVPPSFWVMFISQKDGLGLNKDIRGVPDSVASATITKFALNFEVDITRDASDSVIIAFPDGMTPGIDSVVFVDKITRGGAFHHTFTTGNSQAGIPFGRGISNVLMTVYYDRRAAGTPMPALAEQRSEPLLYPNPVRRGSRLMLGSAVPDNARYEIFNLLGERVGSSVETPQASGLYIARIFGSRGELLATEKLVVEN